MPVVPEGPTNGLVSIGPVLVDLGDPSFSWTSAPTGHGIRGCTIKGSVSWAAVNILSELVTNPDARTTVAGRTGIPEFIEFNDDLLGGYTGYYLLEGFSLDPEQRHSLTDDDAPFTLEASYLGDVA